MKQNISLAQQNLSTVNKKYLIRAWLPVIIIALIAIAYRPMLANEAGIAQLTDTAGNTVPFPNDPAYQNKTQYALDMLNVPAAWNYTHGDPKVVVALIDTGIEFAHPELADHIHPDAYNFLAEGESAQDDNGHGTLAAGIIGAATNNNLGAAGIASNVQLLPIKVSGGNNRQSSAIDEQLAPTYGFADPIRYAASPDRNGTRVININFATSIDDADERAAIGEATKNGVLVVAATGNTGQNRALFPAAYDCVLGVGAVDANAQRASFATYGLGVDVVAPGVAIYGTDLLGARGYTTGDYGSASGTSFASPHAAGVAALIFSARPDLSAWDVREIIMRSAKDLGPIGFDAEYGYGLIDAGAAMSLAKVWHANSAQVLDQCTGERYRVYGSLYLDQNQNGGRDASDLAFSEPYTATTTYVELYGRNGTKRLAVTYPNAQGIFTFDLLHNVQDAPYTLKLQNSTVQQTLFFSAGMAGPYNIDMLTLPTKSVTVNGTLFVDGNGDGLQNENDLAYMGSRQIPATVGLYAPNGQTPVATATIDSQGKFVFYVAPPTSTVTYELRANVVANMLAGTRIQTVTVNPTLVGQAISTAIGVMIDTMPTGEDAQTGNPLPIGLQVISRTGSIALSWITPQPLLDNSVFEVSYARQAGGPYQVLGTTAFAQTTNYTIFDLSSLVGSGDYYFVVRARTRDAQTAFWSGYSNEAKLHTGTLPETSPEQTLPVQSAANQIFLPLVNR